MVNMRRVVLAGVALVAGCKKTDSAGSATSGGGDCDIVTKDPSHAMVALAKKYPHDPLKVAQTIETCVAPTGDECDRAAALVKAIPTMAPSLSAPRSTEEYAKTCRESPPEMRKCYLASYAISHDAECKKMLSDLAGANVALAKATTRCDGGTVIAYVSRDGVWLATGKDPAARCFSKRAGNDIDKTWLETELSQFKTKDCRPDLEVAADKDIRYQEVISVMDVAVKVGLVDVELTPAEALPFQLQTATGNRAPHCPATTIAAADMTAGGSAAGSAAAPVPTGSRTMAPSAAPDLVKGAPVIIVTREEISLRAALPGDGSGSATDEDVGTVKDAEKGTGVIKGLADALLPSASADSPIILQADQDTPSGVIDRIVMTARSKGYLNVLFAVKSK